MKGIQITVFLIILALAFFLRVWRLEMLPPGLYPDEAINGNEAFQALKTGKFELFYPENNGRESLFIWLLAVSFSAFGVSIWSLRIVPAFMGFLTVVGFFLLGKELFSQGLGNESQAENISLAASFFLAVSFWHINFSRIVFRAIMFPLVMVFSFYFLLKGLRRSVLEGKTDKKAYCDVIKGGIVFGLGFYTYTSFRMIAVLLLALLFLWFWIAREKGRMKDFFLLSLSNLLSIGLIVLPLAIYFAANPGTFMGRASQVLVFSQDNPIKIFLKNLFLYLGMFNFHGDGNWRHNLAGAPELFWPVGILFLAGIVLALRKGVEAFNRKDWLPFSTYLFLFLWFFITLSPGILTSEGAPHALRTIGAIPAVYLFCGLSALFIFQWLWKSRRARKLVTVSSCFFLFMVAMFQFNKYFFQWGLSQETRDAFAQDYVTIGNYLNSLPAGVNKVVIVNASGVPVPWPNGLPMPAQTVMFMENANYGTIRSQYILPEQIKNINEEDQTTIIVPLHADEQIKEVLETSFPKGKVLMDNKILIYQI